MSISHKQFMVMVSYFLDMHEAGIPEWDWVERHTKIELDDITHTVAIPFDNMNEEDYKEWKNVVTD